MTRGFALVAVLLLIAVVSLVTATVLQTTSTEIQISGNHKRAVQEFYAAEAGLAEALSRLRKTMGNRGRISSVITAVCCLIRCGLPTLWHPQSGLHPSIPSILRTLPM